MWTVILLCDTDRVWPNTNCIHKFKQAKYEQMQYSINSSTVLLLLLLQKNMITVA